MTYRGAIERMLVGSVVEKYTLTTNSMLFEVRSTEEKDTALCSTSHLSPGRTGSQDLGYKHRAHGDLPCISTRLRRLDRVFVWFRIFLLNFHSLDQEGESG